MALLADNLNAEISLGTVTNVQEAVRWLSYTYLYVRMRKNPLVYGMKYQELKEDPLLEYKRTEIIQETARKLDKAKMIRSAVCLLFLNCLFSAICLLSESDLFTIVSCLFTFLGLMSGRGIYFPRIWVELLANFTSSMTPLKSSMNS